MIAALVALLIAAPGFAHPHPDVGALFDCLDGRATLVSAHRGGPGPGLPEHALETFARTTALGPAIVEADVRRTGDGVLVLSHDETLERATTGRGRWRDLDWAEAARLRRKDPDGRVTPFAPTRLDAALDWARGRTILQLDVKEPDAAPAIVAAVRAARAHGYVTLVFYRNADAIRAAALDPRLTVHANVGSAEELATLEAAGLPTARINAWTGTGAPQPELWRALGRRRVSVVHGTIGARDEAIAMTGENRAYVELARQGVDILATDRPGAALAALGVERTRRALRACGVK